jgi:calcineurin-like phosphoesterase family protein
VLQKTGGENVRDYWVTSDTHFFHSNSLEWEHGGVKQRPGFKNIEELNELIVENWNRVVKPGDYVYHLGDVVFWRDHGQEAFNKLWGRLVGKKRLIVGNHDDVNALVRGGYFSKVRLWKYFHEFGLIMTHTPLHPCAFEPAKRFANLGYTPLNVHGHLHTIPSPEGPYRNVCVEVTNYTPVNLEEIRERRLR